MRSLLPLLMFATACGTAIRATAINPAPHAMRARAPASVEVFTSGPPQGRPYTDIAYLEAEQQSEYSVDDMPDFIAELRARAAKMGCDGLVVGAPTNGEKPDAVSALFGGKRPSLKGVVGTCIQFTQPSVAGYAAGGTTDGSGVASASR